MKKIFVDKNEGVAEVVEKIIAAEDADVTLAIPKGSPLAASLANFNLIRREAQAAQKNVSVESVDDVILAFAKESGLGSSHPFFDGAQKSSSLSDIVPAGRSSRAPASEPHEPEDEEPPMAAHKRRRKIKVAPQEEAYAPAVAEEPEAAAESEAEKAVESRETFFFERSDRYASPAEEEAPSRNWKPAYIIGGIIIGIALVAWGVTAVFGHATVTIDFQKKAWTYNHAITANTTVSAYDAANGIVPAVFLTIPKNLTKLFPATGSKNVSEKAQGTITIYNAYSSSPQTLVATTRFAAPDGKIFRITAAVVVPGAQITNGTIVPASIDATVTADQAGPDYNEGPVAKLTIPGFQGSPKYAAFYGELKNGTQGGFSGNKAVPTADDISKAKDSMTSILSAALQSGLLASYPENVIVPDGASSVSITKLSVSTDTDASGNFSVFGEATMSALGICKADPCGTASGTAKSVTSLLTALAAQDDPGDAFTDLSLTYGSTTPDFKNGILSFTLQAQGTLEAAFSADDFKTKLLGQSVNTARSLISALPGLADARISVWPVWLGSIPTNSSKIKIIVN
ncbi:MAG TPA: hypothetical protein VNG29_00960 [Candidatus Paceibacterota bacterium]|nr:hypothetical protein [Candidatus Paceibacterota bacterium]